MQRLALVLFFLLTLSSVSASADSIRVAVAANFHPVMRQLAEAFEKSSEGHRIELVIGSSGKLAAQIIQGAPFDLFLSADTVRPQQLDSKGVGIKDTRKTYANGQLVALLRYQKETDSGDDQSEYLNLRSFDVNRIAIANPDLAPYGRAAVQALDFIGFQFDRKKLVYGENVSQAFHFFETGNVDAAFVGLSQVLENDIDTSLYLVINKKYYEPIEQQMILLSNKYGARELYSYLLSPQAQYLIGQSGYDAGFEIQE